GVFRYVEGNEPGEPGWVAVNHNEITADPDLLRQWIHHGRAELVFRHYLLGDKPYRLLLGPGDRDDAHECVEALVVFAESLVSFIPEEGMELARLLAGRW